MASLDSSQRRPVYLLWCIALLLGRSLPASGQQPESSPVDAAAKLLQRQVAHFGDRPHGLSHDYYAATAVMNYVQSRVSPLNYSMLIRAGEQPPQNPDECLVRGAGICGSQVAVFLALAERIGLQARSVEFYLQGETPDENSSHIAVEVFYDEDWHFFDVTWGTVFRKPDAARDDVLSITEILAADSPRDLAESNETDLWFQQWIEAGLDPLVYVDWKPTDVLRGHSGTIHLRATAEQDGDDATYVPVHQPNHVGRPPSSVDGGSIELRLIDIHSRPHRITIEVLGVAGTGTLVVGTEKDAIQLELSEIDPGELSLSLERVAVEDELSVSVTTGDPQEIGYLVFQKIRLHQAEE